MDRHGFMQKLSARTGLTQVMLNKVFDAGVEIIIEELKAGGRVVFNKFGIFSTKRTKNRRIITPKGEVVLKGPETIPVFKFTKEFKEIAWK